MTLDQLKIFLAVAEREHITQAAQALNLTQSSVSSAIAALENRYGTHLFHRVGRRIELTDIGRSFVPEARAVLTRAEAAQRLLADFGDLERGRLSVAASQTIASYWLPRRLADFRRHHPHIQLDISIGNTHRVAQAVLDGAADLGLVEGAVDEPALAIEQVGTDRLVIVLAPEHPFLEAEFTVDRLAELDWVSREPGSGTRTEFERSLASLGLEARKLRVVLEMPSNEAVLGAVESGIGAAAISELVAANRLAMKRLRRLPVALPQRQFHFLKHKERYQSRISEAFLATIRMAG